jgi:hypothetical protein
LDREERVQSFKGFWTNGKGLIEWLMGSLCGEQVEMGILILWLLAAILRRCSDAIMDALSCWVLYSFWRGITDNSLRPREDDLNSEASSSRESVGSSSRKN